MSIQVFCSFFVGVVCLMLSCMSYLYILEIHPLSVALFANIFLPFYSLSFNSADGLLWCAEFFWFRLGPIYFCFCFALGYCQRIFGLYSLLVVLWCHVLHLSLYAHFEFIFVYCVRMCSNFIDSQAAVQLSQHHLLRRLFSSLCIFASSVKG